MFSWSVVAGAARYELVVYGLAELDEAHPVVEQQIVGSASGWTPTLDSCLEQGHRYVWLIRAVVEDGPTEWSEPAVFEVAASRVDLEISEALEVVQSYLDSRRPAEVPSAGGDIPPERDIRQSEKEAPGVEALEPAAPVALSVDGGVEAASFTGDGSTLTALDPANLSSGTAAIDISGSASTATTASSAQDLNCVGCVATAELDFDPATEEELTAHGADSAAHHAPTVDTDTTCDGASCDGTSFSNVVAVAGDSATSFFPVGALEVSRGGTGGTSASVARSNLGVAPSVHGHQEADISDLAHTVDTSCDGQACDGSGFTGVTASTGDSATDFFVSAGSLEIARGGTGGATPAAARTNLGAAGSLHNHLEADITDLAHTVDTDTTCDGAVCDGAEFTNVVAASGDSATGFFSSGSLPGTRIANRAITAAKLGIARITYVEDSGSATGNCTTLRSKLSGLTGPATLVLGPGIYDCESNAVVVPVQVSLVGAGRGVTTIAGNVNGLDGLVRLLAQSELRSLTVVNDGGGVTGTMTAVGVGKSDSTGFRIQDVTAIGRNGTSSNRGIVGSSLGICPAGVILDVTATALGAPVNRGVSLSCGPVRVTQLTVLANTSGNSTALGILSGGSVFVRDSTLQGSRAITGAMTVISSEIDGTIEGLARCVGAFDENGVALADGTFGSGGCV